MQVKTSADLAAYDKNGRLALVVEIKSRQHTSADWAARMRGNLFAHGIVPKVTISCLQCPIIYTYGMILELTTRLPNPILSSIQSHYFKDI